MNLYKAGEDLVIGLEPCAANSPEIQNITYKLIHLDFMKVVFKVIGNMNYIVK